MNVLRSYRSVPDRAKGTVMALGNFDGVHRGHQAVIAQTLSKAKELGVPVSVMVFEPHPREIFKPDEPPFRLMNLEIKCRVLASLGVEFVFALPFDAAFSSLSAQDFVMDVLVHGLSVVHVVAGPDFRFGKGRNGDMAMLSYMGEAEGFSVESVAPVMPFDGMDTGSLQISSSSVRRALRDGDPRKAAELLGRDWFVEGRVASGHKRGRTIGFPTANLHLDGLLQPKLGVYVVRVHVLDGEDAGTYGGVANLGQRPTFGHSDVVLEAHLFDFQGDLYDRQIVVELIHFLRAERKFDGIDALKAQIRDDADAARAILNEAEFTS
jgi:riboflavin kinase/FMN adenylyltransferase